MVHQADVYRWNHLCSLLHLQKVLDIARHLLENFDENHQSLEVEEKEHKLQQLRTVLEMFVFNTLTINHIP